MPKIAKKLARNPSVFARMLVGNKKKIQRYQLSVLLPLKVLPQVDHRHQLLKLLQDILKVLNILCFLIFFFYLIIKLWLTFFLIFKIFQEP